MDRWIATKDGRRRVISNQIPQKGIRERGSKSMSEWKKNGQRATDKAAVVHSGPSGEQKNSESWFVFLELRGYVDDP